MLVKFGKDEETTIGEHEPKFPFILPQPEWDSQVMCGSGRMAVRQPLQVVRDGPTAAPYVTSTSVVYHSFV